MSSSPRRVCLLVVLALVASLSSIEADDVTINGTVAFSALDGSSSDHDGLADGTFTVDDGDLTIAGTVTCNDDHPLASGAGACPMRFVVSGTFTMQPGSALLAENRRGTGNGGNITIEAAGDIVLAGGTGPSLGGRISSSRTSTTSGNGDTGGTITLDAGGDVTLGVLSTVSANALNARAGAVNIHADDEVVVEGVVTSGPSSVVLPTAWTGSVLLGGSLSQRGGPISITSACTTEPAITVLRTGVIVSQGESPGAGVVDLAGCGIEVRGLIASISKHNTSTVKLRSGGDLLVDGRDLTNPLAPTGRLGRVRADATNDGTEHSKVFLLAEGDIQVLGAGSGPFVVTSNPGSTVGSRGGSITARALSGGITATGKAFQAGIDRPHNIGGLIDLAAAGAVDLTSARLEAVGGHNTHGIGGSIKIRSHAAGVSWTSGVGDVRPTGSGVSAARRGKIAITACDPIDISGSQFPTNGAPVPPFPQEITGECSSPQPTLPSGETLPICVDDAPAVSTTSPANGATNVARNANITITFTEDVNLADATAFTLECPVGSPQAFTLTPAPPGGVDSFTLDPSSNLPTGAVCTVTVVAARVTDVDANDPPDNMAADFAFSFTVADTLPTAVDDTATVNEDSGPNAIDVLANDTDPDGGPKTIQSVVQPANGTVVITGGGTGLTYQPNANYCNTPSDPPDTFTYTLNGGSTATVSVTVTCVTDAGVAVDDTATVAEDSGPTPIDVLANDTPPDTGTNTIQSVTQPANGTVVITGGGTGLTYQPNANYCNAPPGTSPDVFTYTINGGSVGDVSVTVTCVDDDPIAVNDSATVAEDSGPTAINVLANDTNPDDGPMSIASVTQPANGAVVITGGGTGLTYQPNPNYCNAPPGTTPDTFTYTLTPGGSTATVSVTVTCVDDPPVAVNDSATVNEDSGANAINVLANDTDIDGGPKSVASVTQPANGAVVITGGGSGLTYQPNPNYCNAPPGTSPDTFTYTLNGGSVGTVTVAVTCVNDPPVAQPKVYAAQANMKVAALGGLLTGVTDADAGVNGCSPTFMVSAVSSTTPAGGLVTNLDPVTGTFDFEPPPGVTGNVSFTYTVQDNGCPGTATSAPAVATVTVAGPVIWFVDSTAPAGGNGTWTGTNAKAFQTLAQAAAVDASNHRIFVLNNSGTSISYTGGIVLNTGEWLVGQGAVDTSFDTAMAISPPAGTVARPAINGVRPTFTGTVQVNTRSASSVVKLLGFNLATGTSTGLTNGGTNIDGVTVDLGSVTTSTGTAVSITGTANGSTTANSFRFVSVSSNGAANGIDLRNSVGSFEVTGDGSDTSLGGNASGGTISNAAGGDGLPSGNGIYLENVQLITLRRMTINGTNQNHGIRGVNVNGFRLEFSTVSGANGTNAGLDEGSVTFDNLLGTATITSSIVEGGLEENLNVVNTSGTLNRLIVTGSTFGFNNAVSGNNNILMESQNVGTVMNFTIQSSLIKGARADWINANALSGSSMNAVIGGTTGAFGNTFDNLGVNAHSGSAPGGNRVVIGSTATMTVDIRNNTLRGARGEAIRVRSTGIAGGITGNVTGHVRNNTIGAQATANSGSSEGSGIFVFGDGGGDMTLNVTSNQVFQYNNHGILLQFGDELNEGSVFNVTVTGNTVSTPGTINTDFNAIHLNNGTVGATDNFTSCVDIGGAGAGNIVAGGGKGTIPPNNTDIRLRQRQSTTVRLPGYGGANNDDAAVVAYLTGRNTLTTAAASNTVPTGGGFIGGAACAQP